jgi:hypothetical protein
MQKDMISEIKVFNDSPPISKLVDLAKSYYQSGEIISEKYLDWQYNKNPFGYPYYSLAFDKDLVVGQYLVIPLKYRINNSIINGTLSLNTLTHPNYQGKGLFIKMATETYEFCRKSNISLTVGFPNPLSYGGFVKKLNFKSLGYCDLMICVLRPFTFLKNQFQLKKKKNKHGGDVEIKIELKNRSNCNTIITNLTTNDCKSYDIFWNSITEKSNLISLDKTWDYINWRYFEIPSRKYYLIKSVQNGIITSVCAFRVEKVLGTNTAIIMDLLMLDECDAKLLLKEIKRNLRKNKINAITIIRPNNIKVKKLLVKNYFFKIPKKILPQPIPYIFLQHNKINSNIKIDDIFNWTVSFGDYDIF